MSISIHWLLDSGYKRLKDAVRSVPIVAGSVLLRKYLTNECQFVVWVFVLLILFSKHWPWDYKHWPEEGRMAQHKKRLSSCHFWLDWGMYIIPAVLMLVYYVQAEAPESWDHLMIKTSADPAVANAVTRFRFAVGTPQPTNYTVSYVGIANIKGADMFETAPMFRRATSGGVVLITTIAEVLCLLWFVFVVGLAFAIFIGVVVTDMYADTAQKQLGLNAVDFSI